MNRRIIRVNAGGRIFETLRQTLCRYPDSALAKIAATQSTSLPPMAAAKASAPPSTKPKFNKTAGAAAVAKRKMAAMDPSPSVVDASEELFLDVDPRAFEIILQFLRTGSIQLPTNDDVLRCSIVHLLEEWKLSGHAFPPPVVSSSSSDSAAAPPPGIVELPDVLAVQMCDHMQLENSVKRHAVTITYGSDGFRLRTLCKSARKDLNTQLSSTFWQMYQTSERAAFFVTTKMSMASADLLLTSVSQRVIQHTERMGYILVSSYVTLSPDIMHINTRLLIHWFLFRRVRAAALEEADVFDLTPTSEGELAVAEEGEMEEEVSAAGGTTMYRNYVVQPMGPSPPAMPTPTVPPSQQLRRHD